MISDMEFSRVYIKKLNELEGTIFDWVLSHASQVQSMTIRELSKEAHVSTAAIIRMTKKLGFQGWTDFRFYLNDRGREEIVATDYYENLLQLDLFMKEIASKEFSMKLSAAIRLIKNARYRVFLGFGTSGALAKYAAMYFTNIGLESYVMTDPYQSVKRKNEDGVLTIVLSVSGETDKIVE